MNERLQRVREEKLHLGAGQYKYVTVYEVLSADMRTIIDTCTGIEAALKSLERNVRLEKLACSNGSCED